MKKMELLIFPIHWKLLFYAPYGRIRAPEKDPQPIYVRNVLLTPTEGKIEIEPELINYTEGPKAEGFVTLAEEDDGSRAISAEITFDLDKREYYVEVDRLDNKLEVSSIRVAFSKVALNACFQLHYMVIYKLGDV